ncbi:hypothetical protein A3A49_01760 [Candidatus Curtissbacteria bacterium RIFCSPLOWO2_01_FULL_38_11b]|uniref:Cell envelope-related transcriptional attenuator domain-containing protein n=1 Tax=Candidatus Curtissbacteria bacterium RIFCSPLOWO2_01_FULL_38_11b TaxID=1797725 RepID=A0A1F5H493_9BACT|nr:MAG: hypothetical protein A3A49_01760 [Candidatus Curtissbacteria bacterium RIFCSPLOWO2_01_FULL_38_11b]
MREIGIHHSKSSKKGRILKILFLTVIFTAMLVIIIKFLDLDKNVLKGPRTVVKLITNSGLDSDNNRVNVLLLGTGGTGHEGPDLTDTMILASLEEDAKDVILISIPRDLWAGNISAKINHAYAYGQEKDGVGLKLSRETIESLLGLPVHYAVRVDFSGFVKAVDLVGGLDVDVESPFNDTRYPIAGKEDDLCNLTLEIIQENGQRKEVVKTATGSAIPLLEINDKNDPFTCRYENLTFQKGPTRMDGTTSLKFVRSRYGTNGEGSDFARSARQQKVLLAFRQQVLSKETLTNPKTTIDLIKTFGASIDTDILDEDIPLFAKLATKIDPATIRRIVLDATRQDSVLQIGDPTAHGGQYVLVPKGTWEDLADYLNGEIFKLEEK